MNPRFLVGRVLFGGFTFYFGINQFLQRKNFAQYAAARNVPMKNMALLGGALAPMQWKNCGLQMVDNLEDVRHSTY